MKNEQVIFMDSELRQEEDTKSPLISGEESRIPRMSHAQTHSRVNEQGEAGEGLVTSKIPDGLRVRTELSSVPDQSGNAGDNAGVVSGERTEAATWPFLTDDVRVRLQGYFVEEKGPEGQGARINAYNVIGEITGLLDSPKDPELFDKLRVPVDRLNALSEKYSDDEGFSQDMINVLGGGNQKESSAINEWIEGQVAKAMEGGEQTTDDTVSLAQAAGVKDIGTLQRGMDVARKLLEPLLNERGAVGGGGSGTGGTTAIAAPPSSGGGGSHGSHGHGGHGHGGHGHEDDAARLRREKREKYFYRMSIFIVLLFVLYCGAMGKLGDMADTQGQRFYSQGR
jgi:hypothetical protein